MMKQMTMAVVLVLAGVTWAQAQTAVIPFTYRVTRSVPTPSQTFTFQKSAMSCGLTPGPIGGVGLRIQDPVDLTKECEYLDATNPLWTNLAPGTAYTFSIAGAAQGSTQYGPESADFGTGVPGAPGGLQIRPGFTGVSVVGTIQQRYPFAGLDVVDILLDGATDPTDPLWHAYVGVKTFGVPGVSVQPGTRAYVAICNSCMPEP